MVPFSIDKNRGYVYNMLNRREEALDDYERARSLQPQKSEGWLRKGYTLVGMVKLPEAARAVQRALTLDPVNHAATEIMADRLRSKDSPFEA